MKIVVAVALFFLLLFPSFALAGVLIPKEPGSKPLTLRKESIRIDVKDQVAWATLDEVFENATDQTLEGTYLLPLPDGAAVSGFATWVDGQRVESRIQQKKDAEASYEKAQAEHKAPALLEKDDASTFKTRVDGIAPHGTKRIEASFAEILPYDSGLVTLRVPMVTRSASGSETAGDFSIELNVADQKRIAELKVLSHPAKIEQLDGQHYRVSLGGKNVALKDELVVTYRTESSKLGLSFIPFKPASGAGQPNSEGYFLLLASPQELTTSADIVHKDIVFVFDTSGSMSAEDKIGQARSALQKCLGSLNPEDRFAVIAFSDSLNPFKTQLLPASPANVRAAMEFAQGLAAEGGTNISGALTSAMQLLASSDRPRVIVFMTDGQPTFGITDPAEIARLIKAKNEKGTRLFTFGVGSDVNRTFLEQLGRENRGASDFIDHGQSIDTVVAGFYAKIAKPVLSDLSIDFGTAVTTTMQYPDVLPDLYKGSQLVLVGRYRGSGKVNAKLVGTLNGARHEIPFVATFPDAERDNTFVARLWAQRRIDFLLGQNRLQGEREEAKAEVIALSEQYQIITPYTAMVAVKQDTLVASISPQRVKPGDPIVTIRAPRSAKSVRVRLPFGEELAARWDDEAQAWSARFLIPPGTPDGTYPIAVRIEGADGQVEKLALELQVDTTAPVMSLAVAPITRGHLATLRANALVAPGEVVRTLWTRSDPFVAMKQLFDVRSVSARLWDGREIAMALEGRGFVAQLETNASMAPGRYPVVITAQDFAGNESQATTFIEVRP